MATSLQDLRSRQEPFWSYRWTARIPGFDRLYVEQCDLPVFRSFSPLTTSRGFRTYNYAGGSEGASSFNITFFEDAKLVILETMQSWGREVQDPDTGKYGLPKDYKRDCEFDLENVAGLNIRTIKLLGCWPVSVSPYALQSATAERIMVQATFAADDIK